jgi:hypothetical protein
MTEVKIECEMKAAIASAQTSLEERLWWWSKGELKRSRFDFELSSFISLASNRRLSDRSSSHNPVLHFILYILQHVLPATAQLHCRVQSQLH